MRKLTGALLLTLAACGGGAPAAPTQPAATEAPTSRPVDPYEVYLANNPDPSLILSREDAQTRALLGCGQQWAPKTVDAALQEAYQPPC